MVVRKVVEMALGISMVMLSADEPIRGADVQRNLARNWPDLPAATEVDEGEDSLSLQLGESSVIMAKMPAPIPWSQLEGPCETSILWPDAKSEVEKHAVHWIVTANGELDPIELATLLTQATAATMGSCENAIGVYWGNATLVVPKEMFCEIARDVLPEEPPLLVWVDFRVGPDSEKSTAGFTAGFTAGMTALGHMEFETQRSPEPPSELRDRLMGLAGYVIENGPVIQDGDTIGEDANERIRVVYSKSEFGHEGNVMRLAYEAALSQKLWKSMRPAWHSLVDEEQNRPILIALQATGTSASASIRRSWLTSTIAPSSSRQV